jgi:hypothetical protein
VIGGRLVYFHIEPNGKVHLFELRLDDVTVTPVPRQIGTLELDSTDSICSVGYLNDNLYDEATAKILLRVAGSNRTCRDSDDQNQIIPLSGASAGTLQATTFQSDFSGFFYPVYDQSGARIGILYDDKATSTFGIIQQPDLSHVVPLIPHDANFFNYSFTFANLQFTSFFTVMPSNRTDVLYWASIGGESRALYSVKGIFALGPTDSNNIYFSDSYDNSFDIYQAPLTATDQPFLLFSEPGENRRALLASTGSKLILFRYDPVANITRFQFIPVNAYSGIATDFKTYVGQIIDRVVYVDSGADPTAVNIIVTRWDGSSSSPGYVTDIFNSNGVNIVAPMDKVVVQKIIGWAPRLIAYKGMTDTNGNFSNATINDFDINTGVMTSYKNPDGSEFKVSDGQIVLFDRGGSQFAMAQMGFPDPNNPRSALDNSKLVVTLIVDFVSRTIYQLPSSTSGETLHY